MGPCRRHHRSGAFGRGVYPVNKSPLSAIQPRILIVWASRGGNTANLAQRILEVFESQGLPATLAKVTEIDFTQLASWSAVIAGSPTYGAGDLHPDWDRPERLLREVPLSGIPAAVFGCGNPRYVTPYWAVDILENRFRNQGASIVVPSYKADTLAGFRVRDADEWIKALAAKLLGLLGDRLHEPDEP